MDMVLIYLSQRSNRENGKDIYRSVFGTGGTGVGCRAGSFSSHGLFVHLQELLFYKLETGVTQFLWENRARNVLVKGHLNQPGEESLLLQTSDLALGTFLYMFSHGFTTSYRFLF